MKALNRSIKYGAILIAALAAGCSKVPTGSEGNTETDKIRCFSVPGPSVTTDGEPLTVSVYIFSSPSGLNRYTLTDKIASIGSSATYRFHNGDLVSNDYRFLFIATGTQPEIGLFTKTGSLPEKGIAWEDIVLRTLTSAPGTDNYYSVETLTGKQIEATDRITGRLTRIVGQTIFEFTRSSDASKVVPTDIISPDVGSVLDRVNEIKITYSGVPTEVGFDNEGKPVTYGANIEVSQTIAVRYDPSDMKVSVPQTDNGIDPPISGVKGGARIMGLCMLPSNSSISTNMIFTYFDTTPACGNNHTAGESHNTSCYDTRSITLDIPPFGSTGLSVLSDTFTVSKIGLPCDRIIDVPETNSINIDFNWN